MKNVLKNMLVISVLLFGASFVKAQAATVEDYAVGDTIMVKRSCTHYLTGEEPSKWVYFVQHTILQVGGKRFPNGILVKGIMSWVGPDDIIKVNSDEGLEELAQRATEIENMSEADRRALDAYARRTGTTVMRADDQLKQRFTKQPEPVKEPEPVVEPEPEPEPEPVVVVEPEPEPVVEEVVEEPAEEPAERNQRLLRHHRASVGLRVGVASLLQDASTTTNYSDGKWKPGFDVLIDGQYSYFFGAKEGKRVNHGITTGLSLGWAQSRLKGVYNDQFSVTSEGTQIDYTVTSGKVNERDGQLQLEIPIMYSLLTDFGLFFNTGVRLAIPVYGHYKQELGDDAVVTATFPDYQIAGSLVNEPVTGLISSDDLKSKGKFNHDRFNLFLTAEIGYNLLLKNTQSIDFGVYANYSVVDAFKKDQSTRMIVVTPPTTYHPSDNAEVLSSMNTYGKGLGFFDCGVKVIYHFNFFK